MALEYQTPSESWWNSLSLSLRAAYIFFQYTLISVFREENLPAISFLF